MNPTRVLLSSTFRLGLIYMTMFGVSVLVLLGFIYWTTAGFMERQTDETINAEVLGLAEQYSQLGLSGLVKVINTRVAGDASRQSLYMLADVNFKPLAGNLARWPQGVRADTIWANIIMPQPDERHPRHLRLRKFILQENYHLLVGRDVSDRNKVERLIIDSLGWGLAMTTVLGIIGGLVLSRGMLRRLDVINRTSREIMAGDLARRIPVTGTDDEFDQISRNLNDMLDKIVQLMDGVRRVSDNIAHDLRSPLTRMKSRLEVALIGEADKQDYQNVINQTIAETDEILRTFNSLLKISQAEAGLQREDLADVDLSTLARDLAELYHPLAEEKEQAITLNIRDGLIVRGNRHLLSQVLANLLDNAVKFTPQGGTIEVHVTAFIDERSKRIVELCVADSGPGVPEEDREKVLTRFYRLEHSRSTPGSGLGLSLVAAVATLHHAELQLLDNDPGLKIIMRFKDSGKY